MDNNIIYEDVESIIRKCNLSELKGKTVLITGASGLFGTYFLYTLSCLKKIDAKPYKVYAVIHRNVPSHLQDLCTLNEFEFIQGDLSDQAFCESLPKADYIIHASGYGQPGKFLTMPVSALKQNTLATFTLLDKLNEGGKFLYVSSGAVYAENPKEQYSEEDISFATILHPRLCYIEGKRCGEAICELYRREGMHVRIVRPSFTYGPGVRSDDVRVLYDFIRKAFNGEIRMLDSGRGVHVYQYISDAIVEMWNALLFGKQVVYNIAGHCEISIKELAEKIGGMLGAKVVMPTEEKTVPGAMMQQYVNPERIEQEFKIDSFVTMEQGLSRTVEWFTKNYR